MIKNRNPSSGSALVYSTDGGRHCPACRQPILSCTCHKAKPAVSGDGIVRIKRESKGRAGKVVTVISGVPLAQDELKTLAAQLKKLCGCGGAIKEEGVIEIQGEHIEQLLKTLKKLGFQVKKTGG